MDLYTLATAIYLACGVVFFALRDQKKRDYSRAHYRPAVQSGMAIDHTVTHFATALTEQRMRRGPTSL